MRLSWLVLSVFVSSTAVMADNVTVYRWVDKNNVVHFSQHQPDHNNFTEISVSTKTPRSVLNSTNDVEESTEDTQPLQIAGSSEKCEEAKANVRVLKSYDKIEYTDENGDKQLLSATEKQQQLAINEKQVEVYCVGQ
ncbi:DUF4124 domain-containing protein [Thalassotalea fusca]